ncbi:MAG: threonine--tRNA ligase, partial [Patescibacteria group bacterium]
MQNLENVRHSLAHLLAASVLEKFPKTKLGIGPTIENGFYYDFLITNDYKSEHELSRITDDDLLGIEKGMRRLINQKLPFFGRKVTAAEAKKIFKDQPFKIDLIKEFAKDKKPLTVYITGHLPENFSSKDFLNPKSYILNSLFIDLCRGGHVKNTSEINPDAFKLTHIAGAYWRGSEKNPQLQRIYGVAFGTKKELENYLEMLKEAKKRDHRELGKRLKLFTFNELVGSGLPIWLPNGTIIKDEIENFAKEMETKYGYQRISTPHIAKEELFKKSGHLPYYAESMFPPMKLDDGNYYVKAMNCPIAHLVYKSEPRSYRDLPLRLAEYGTVYRNELSGTLAGLLRVRMLSMNDAHIYCREDQIEEEFKSVVELTLHYFKVFGFKDYWFRLSLWNPKNKKKYINEPKNWKTSEEVLRNVLKKMGVKCVEAQDEAAFYGPKVDIQFKSVVGREETMSTIQLDFAAKSRFDLNYHDKNGKENKEVFVIHRAPL